MLFVVRRLSDGKFRSRVPGRINTGWVSDPTSPGCVMSQEKAESLASPTRGKAGMEAVWLGHALGVKEKSDEVGRKFDRDKLRYDLVDDDAEAEFVAVLTFGSIKYEPGNWARVEDAQARYFAAVRRHLRSFRRGEV